MLLGLFLIASAYLIGSVASAIVVCRLMKLPDPRSGGSGNPGATNVLRVGGKLPAALTLVGDVLKGLLPVVLASALSGPWVVAATATAAFLGHLYPIYFKFKGGKGVATAFGATAGLAWPVMVAMGITWLAVVAATRYVSLASMVAVGLSPVVAFALALHPATFAALAVMAGFIIYRHKANIERLRSGTESRIGENTEN
ncbi:MAG: glycerol-3-phosphate 1-O-acyltransferase PlsY [Gammaproteobacteria bacterium]|nr:glycerol-3-phosphate 1-O-acyltransferase PlsY [Gammaproteobacteria bacterium]MDH3413581.1 glycerol-3-phosphate 1-O-acyltransferase PlsY [Gammaproteobacteria bacterium]